MQIPTLCKRMWLMAGILPCLAISQPKVSIVGGTTFDFGEVLSSSTPIRKITIKNVGTDTLIISEVSASCGCTGTLMSNDHIAPNDSGLLSITFDPQGRSGPVEKSVSMTTNDTSQIDVDISFKANVINILGIDPSYLFLRAEAGSPATETLALTNLSSQTIKILSVSSNSADFTAKISSDEIKPGEEATITGVLTTKAAGTVSGNFEIATDHPKAPRLSIRFFAWVKEKSTTGSSHN